MRQKFSLLRKQFHVASGLTYGEFKTSKAFLSMIQIDALFRGESDSFNVTEYIDEALTVICDGTVREYDNWTITAQIDVANDSITFTVASK